MDGTPGSNLIISTRRTYSDMMKLVAGFLMGTFSYDYIYTDLNSDED